MDLPVQQDELGRIVELASAIFHAEGFWTPGARPRRNNNPGDMLDHTGQNIRYADLEDGAAAAAHQVMLMIRGESHVYELGMTWRRVAQLWTGGDNAAAWCEAVCDDLQVSPDSTFGLWVRPLQLANPATQAADPAPSPSPQSPALSTSG